MRLVETNDYTNTTAHVDLRNSKWWSFIQFFMRWLEQFDNFAGYSLRIPRHLPEMIQSAVLIWVGVEERKTTHTLCSCTVALVTTWISRQKSPWPRGMRLRRVQSKKRRDKKGAISKRREIGLGASTTLCKKARKKWHIEARIHSQRRGRVWVVHSLRS